MSEKITKLALKNLIAIPLLQVQGQLISQVPDVASRNILNVGLTAQAGGLALSNVKDIGITKKRRRK